MNRLFATVCLALAVSTFARTPLRAGEPLETAGELASALAGYPETTPVRLPTQALASLELRDGVIVLAPADAPPSPSPGATRSVYGDYLLQPLYHSKTQRVPPFGDRLVSEQELATSTVEGLTIRIIPNDLSKNGQWNFMFVDSCVARCRKLNKTYTLLVAGGGPNLLQESSLAFYEAAAKALGKRYASDPLCTGVHCTGASPPEHSEELFWGNPMPANALAANKRMIDAWTAPFPDQIKILAGSANDPNAMRTLINYGVQKTGGKFLYKNNAMKAGTDLNWAGNTLVVWAGKNGAQMGWEMVGSTLEPRFGGTYAQMYANVATLLAQAGKTPSQRYLAHYPPDVAKIK